MRVLVLGGAGMLGHKVCQVLGDHVEVWVTVRADAGRYAELGLADPARIIECPDAVDPSVLRGVMGRVKPAVVINAIGIVKQRGQAKEAIPSIQTNSILPHLLADACADVGSRMVHVSTDCVFSGAQGSYREIDVPDPPDLYGRTKLLGEVDALHVLTLRTSIIGREISHTQGLLEWFLSQDGAEVEGYTEAIFSGYTTLALSELLLEIIRHHEGLAGLYHASTSPISKYELLTMLGDAYGVDVRIKPTDALRIDRSLDSTRLQAALRREPPDWPTMVRSLAADATPYSAWRRRLAAV